MLMVSNVSPPASLLPERGYLIAQRLSVGGWLFPPFLFTAATESLGRVFFFHSFFIVFEKTGRKVDMRRLSPCVKPQVLVVRMRPISHHLPPVSLPCDGSALSAMWRWSNNQALVKEEPIPRSGGPLDSDWLISQALSRPPARASGCYLSAACSGSA